MTTTLNYYCTQPATYMDKDYQKGKITAIDESHKAHKSEIANDIKKGMDKYESRLKSAAEGEAPPAGDSTRSEE